MWEAFKNNEINPQLNDSNEVIGSYSERIWRVQVWELSQKETEKAEWKMDEKDITTAENLKDNYEFYKTRLKTDVMITSMTEVAFLGKEEYSLDEQNRAKELHSEAVGIFEQALSGWNAEGWNRWWTTIGGPIWV